MDPDALSTTALLARIAEAACSAPSDDTVPWSAIRRLCDRPTREIVAVAARCCQSPERRLRLVGTDILADLVDRRDPPDASACDAILMPLLADADPAVVAAAVDAMTTLDAGDNQAIAALAGHPAREVRVAVASCLATFEDPDTSDALIVLSRDVDPEVRRHAVNGLGAGAEPDSEAIRQALAERVSDPDRDTAEEAIWGLVIRGDPRGEIALDAALARGDTSETLQDAALHRRDGGALLS
jgi:HEAT repeat protein